MASEEMGLVQAQRIDNGLNPHQQLVFPDSFTCGGPPAQRRSATAAAVGVPGPKTTTAGYISHHHGNYYHHHQPTEFRRSIFAEDHRSSHQDSGHNWTSSSRGEGSEDDDDDVDDDDVEDDNEAQGLVTVDNNKNNNNEKIKNNSNNSDAIGLREGNVVEQSGNEGCSDMRNAVTIEGGMYYPQQYLQGTEGSNGRQKDVLVENGVGFSGRRDGFYSSESGESLRAILSDPLTGALMDDAVILPCGHSFGSGGMQHVFRMKACYTCSRAVSEDSVAPNLSLQVAVQAFRREEELHVSRAPKKRREKYDQEKGTYGDSTPSDHPRGRGVQFPFAVTDRVIIKGNKRTPQRFVGREAIVTTQCLNGWYVVKTLDNAESVKLQYRSLAKVPDNRSSKPMSSKTTPHWL